jgi:hypothetical protein
MLTAKTQDYQDQLFFDNLGDEGITLLESATGNIRLYHSILENYLSSVRRNAKSATFTWKSEKFPDNLANNDNAYAIRLSIVQGKEKAEEEYTKKILKKIIDQDIKTLRWVSSKESDNKNITKVIDTYEDEGFITVETLPPENSILFPDMGDFSIQKEIVALRKLMNNPEKHHLPLLRMASPGGDERWEKPDDFENIEWKVLTDNAFTGVEEQRDIVRKALATNNFAILEGPPGSGKTTVISEIILQLLSRRKRVLLVGSTHVAVDNVLEKLIKYPDIVVPIRIAHLDRELPPEVENLTYSKYVKHFKARLLDNLMKIRKRDDIQDEWVREIQQDSSSDFIQSIVNDSINLVSGTTMGVLQFPEIRDSLANKKFDPLFDAMIIDEASKTTFQEFLVPAMFSRKWIISGDPKQLAPYTDRELIEMLIENAIRRVCKLENSQREYDDCQYTCLTSFYATRAISDENREVKKRALILMSEDQWNLRDRLVDQLRTLNPSAIIHEVPDKWDNVNLEKLIIYGSDIVISKRTLVKDFMDAIPYGCVPIWETLDSLRISYQNNYLRKDKKISGSQNQFPNYGSDEKKTLSREVAWRMERYYEMRSLPEKALKYKYQVEQLLPRNTKDLDRLIGRIWDIMYCAFPSIVELLTSGNLRKKPPQRWSVLDSGLPEDFRKLVWTRLSFQYRMHPKISIFPRELVYSSGLDGTTALRDSPKIRREWNYKRYDHRVEWINGYSGKDRNNENGREKNKNVPEAEEIMKELIEFIKYAEGNKHPDSLQWTVAVLSFYKPQTRFLQSLISDRFKGRGQVYFNDDKSVRIFVGNVDSMQGREADIVFLSMVRKGGLGFLDNTNRINVAITRAKYQLVVVGNHWLFCNPKHSDTLIYKFAKGITPNYKFSRRE